MQEFDPTAEATAKLEQAECSISEAIRLLNYFQTDGLMQAGRYLQKVVKELRAGRKAKALAEPIIDRREAARIMGSGEASDQKLKGAQKARNALAAKRAFIDQAQKIRGI